MSCGGAFGSMGVGSGPFGSGSSMEIVSADQVALNAVDVTFSVAPEAFDPATYWDALNPANWTLSVLSPADAELRDVQIVERRSSLVLRVYFDGPLTGHATYRLTISSLVRDIYGVSMAPSCTAIDFDCFGLIRVPPAVARRDARTDIANPFVVSDAPQDGPLGTFQVDQQGDLMTESGRPYLRKRVLRRVITSAGQFFHLPDYGFAEPVNGMITPDTLRRMQSKAKAQILSEPDVADAAVSVSALPDRPGFVVLRIRVVDRNGATEEMTVPLRVFSSS